MFYLLLTIICSTSIGLILKYHDSKKGTLTVLLAGNYLVAAMISGISVVTSSNSFHSVPVALFPAGILLGVVFMISFMAFSKTVEVSGAALASVASRLSVVIPISLSIIFFREYPSLGGTLGLFVALGSVVFSYFAIKSSETASGVRASFFFPALLLIGIGINDFSLKLFNTFFSGQNMGVFLLLIFSSAGISSLIWMKIRKDRITSFSFITGLVLGIPNVFSTWFLIRALKSLPGTIVYPVSNIAIIVLTTILAAAIWKEPVNRYGFLALVSGMVGISLISIF